MPSTRKTRTSVSDDQQAARDAATVALKRRVGYAGAEMVKNGMVVGLGTGSTARFAIERLGQLVNDGLKIKGVPTSVESEKLARELAIPLTTLEENPSVDLTIDGADEVDPAFNLIKGLGGALLREKIVAWATVTEVIVVDKSKLVPRLGTMAPVPVEVVRFEHVNTARKLATLGCTPIIRTVRGRDEVFVTDNGNYIYDCRFAPFSGVAELEICIDRIPGVVESGLFVDIADVVISASENGVDVRKKK